MGTPDWKPASPPVRQILLLDAIALTATPTIEVQENELYRGWSLSWTSRRHQASKP